MSRVKVERDKSEARIQQDAFTQIRNKYPELYGCIYHVPNGEERNPIIATQLTGMGVVPGIQDLHFIWNRWLWLIEMKTPSGTVSVEQKVIHAQHKRQGFDTYIFKDEFMPLQFVDAVIEGDDLSQFDCYISPFSQADKFEEYREEMRIERIRREEAKARKR